MSLKAIAFDIDGTLYPNTFFYLHGIPAFLRHPRATRAYSHIRRAVRALQAEGIDEPLRRLQIRLMAAELAIDLKDAERLLYGALYPSWERWFPRVAKPFRGVRRVLEELRDRGYALGALSDFPLMGKLGALGVDDLFSIRLSAEDVGYLKPHSAPFLALADGLDAAPEEILYVGNSYRYDVLGAKAVGMWTAHLGPGGGEEDYAFRSYEDFPSLD